MLIQGSAKSKRTDILIEKYAELLENGVCASEILVLTLNSFKKNIFINKFKEKLNAKHYENPQIHTFYGLAYNAIMNNWPHIEESINIGEPIIIPNLTGLEISQFFFKEAIKEAGFKDYNSKINLIHQLFRRNSLIVNNNLSDKDVSAKSDILGESFAPDAKTAIDLFKKKTIEHRAFDYIRQVNILNFIYKNTDYFKNIKYLILDDADEITTVEFDFIKHLKPQLNKAFIGYDGHGSSRLGFLNTDVNAVEKIEALFGDYPKTDLDNITKSDFNFIQTSASRRLEMIEQAVQKVSDLIDSNTEASQICIVTPVIDSALKFTISEAFDSKNIKYQYFSGSEKLIETPAVKNTIALLNLTIGEEIDVFKVRAIINEMLKIPLKYCVQIVEKYKQKSKIEFFELGIEEYNLSLRKLIEVIEEIKNEELSLSDKIFVIYKKLIKFDETGREQLEAFNFFLKQIQDFESVFQKNILNPKMQKSILIQLENSIISENPSSAPERKENHVLISTAQKIIDFSIQTKYQIWLDTSSDEWVKEDIGTLYNAWVFQNSWEKDSFTYEDNLELSALKTRKMLRKLALLAEEKIYTYSSLFDTQGNENFNGIETYLSSEKGDENQEINFNFTPRDDQKPVLDYKSGQMAISAVPGAGKTTILLALIIKLLKNRVYPENIFVLTYMDSAARNFKERIKNACPKLDKLPNISTIHGLALRILKENSNFTKAGLDESFDVCDDTQRQKIIKETMYKLQLNPDDFDKYEKAISVLKLSDISKIPYSCDPEIKKFLKFYFAYNLHLKDRNLIDYDDMLSFCVKILEENKDIAAYYQEICEFVIEDEAQDSSVIQQKLLNLLGAKHKNLIRCGDINQAITTTFTNADLDGFRAFIKNSKNVSMNRSQRSSKDVYTLANTLIDFTKQTTDLKNAFYDIKMQEVEGKNPVQKDGVKISKFDDYNQERSYLLEEIRNIFSNDKTATTAILVRNNYQIEEYTNYLSGFGFNIITRSDCLKEQPVFALVFAIIKFCTHPWHNEEVVNTAKILQSQKLYKFNDRDVEFIESLKTPFIMQNQDESTSECLSKLLWDLNYWLENSALALDELTVKIGNYYYFSQVEKSNIYMISLLLKKLSMQYTSQDALIEKIEELSKKPVMNQYRFFSEEEGAERTTNAGQIQIMTYHKAKGDEFDHVFIPQLTEEILPLEASSVKIKSKERFIEAIKGLNLDYRKKDEAQMKCFQIEENLRLFYVAVTRAKKKLYISSAIKYKKFSRVKDYRPSVLFETVLNKERENK